MKPCILMPMSRSFKIAILTASLIWLLAMPLIGASSCGLRFPHEHILLGRVDPQQLRVHLAQETVCQGFAQPQVTTRSNHILSYVPTYSVTVSTILLVLWIAVLLVVVWIAIISGRLLLVQPFPAGRIFPPIAPPPRT